MSGYYCRIVNTLIVRVYETDGVLVSKGTITLRRQTKSWYQSYVVTTPMCRHCRRRRSPHHLTVRTTTMARQLTSAYSGDVTYCVGTRTCRVVPCWYQPTRARPLVGPSLHNRLIDYMPRPRLRHQYRRKMRSTRATQVERTPVTAHSRPDPTPPWAVWAFQRRAAQNRRCHRRRRTEWSCRSSERHQQTMTRRPLTSRKQKCRRLCLWKQISHLILFLSKQTES